MYRTHRQHWAQAFFLVCSVGRLVTGQDQDGRYDILTGRDGITSCNLRDSIHTACNSSIPAPQLGSPPVPSPCTCNKIYFNVWSACVYASGNNTLPDFSNWTGTCSSNSIDLTASAARAASNGIGVTPPSWATIDVPGNSSFDLQRAVVIAMGPPHWTIAQIVAPVAAACVGILCSLAAVAWWRRRVRRHRRRAQSHTPPRRSGYRPGTLNLFSRIRDVLHPVHHVQPRNHAPEGWIIDGGQPPRMRTPPHMVDPRTPISPLETHRDTLLTIHGAPSIPDGGIDESLGNTQLQPQRVVEPDRPPGGRVYVPPLPPPPSAATTMSRTPAGSSRPSTVSFVDWMRGMHLNMRWKSGPVPVSITRPRPGFTIDSLWRTELPASQDTLPSFTTWGPERPRDGSIDMVYGAVYGADEEGFEMDAETDARSEGEDTGLLTEEERQSSISLHPRHPNRHTTTSSEPSSAPGTSVGHGSSIQSIIKIVSPTETSSSVSPRDSNPQSSGEKRHPWSIPKLPPVPSHAAPPAPAAQPQAKHRTSALSHAVMSPILEDTRERSPPPAMNHPRLPMNSIAHLRPQSPEPIRPVAEYPPAPQIPAPSLPQPARRPSGESRRPLPSPGLAHRRSASHTPGPSGPAIDSPPSGSGSANNAGHIRAHSDSAVDAPSGEVASGSGGGDGSSSRPQEPVRKESTGARRPLPTPGGSANGGSATANAAGPSTSGAGAGHLHVMQRSGSASSASLVSVGATSISSPSRGYLSPVQSSLSASTTSLHAPLFRDPWAAGHGQGLDLDDSGSSFYMPEHPGQVRSPPPMSEEEQDEIARGDPALLFPPAVRGAGYRGTPVPR